MSLIKQTEDKWLPISTCTERSTLIKIIKLQFPLSGQDSCLLCEVPGLCEGILLDEDLADSIESCEVDRSNQCAKMKFETSFSQELCRQANLCNFYTFNPTDGLCLEFSTCQSNDEVSCKTCISGQPGCSNGTAVPTTISTTSNPTTAIPNDSDSFLLVVGGRDARDPVRALFNVQALNIMGFRPL